VQDDPEDAETVYDICDELGPWDSLDGREKFGNGRVKLTHPGAIWAPKSDPPQPPPLR
jgi:hypothetical protein